MKRTRLESASSSASKVSRYMYVVAAPLILLGPFINMLIHNSYTTLRWELLIAGGAVVAVGVVAGAVAALRPETLGPVVTFLLLAVFVDLVSADIQIGRYLQIADLPTSERLLAAAAVLSGAIVLWVLRRNLSIILAVVFGTLILSTLVIQESKYALGAFFERPGEADKALPPIIHIVLDEHIGIEGLPADVPGAAELKEDLVAFYEAYGFSLHGGAFSHSSHTTHSLAALFNGRPYPDAVTAFENDDGGLHLKRNAWFDHLEERGYRIRIYQNSWLDFCDQRRRAIAYCYRFWAHSIKLLEGVDLSPLVKARYILRAYVINSGALLASLPHFDFEGTSIGAFASAGVLDRIAQDLKKHRGGVAVFAHLLIPHFSYVFGEDCEPKRNLYTWLERFDRAAAFPHLDSARQTNDAESRERRYIAYIQQVRCLYILLDRFFGKLAEEGLWSDAVILIHSDHGSRIARMDPVLQFRDRLSPQDLTDHFSSLFAVRMPNRTGRYLTGMRSIQALFAESFLQRPLDTETKEVFLWSGSLEESLKAPIKLPEFSN